MGDAISKDNDDIILHYRLYSNCENFKKGMLWENYICVVLVDAAVLHLLGATVFVVGT